VYGTQIALPTSARRGSPDPAALLTRSHGAITVRVSALGEAATELPWLSPCAASLLALARLPAAAAWAQARRDPGAVLLVLRQAAATLTSPSLSFFPSVLRDPAILEEALRRHGKSRAVAAPGLASHETAAGGFVDWKHAELKPILDTALTYARRAERLAERTGRCDPENAWVAGLLAPLGWFAVAAVDAEQAARCLKDPALASDATGIQRQYWAHDQAAIARRLLRRWQVPQWLAVVIGHLGLPVDIAQALGADPELFRIIQLAVALTQEQGRDLGLAIGGTIAENTAALRLANAELDALTRDADELGNAEAAWLPPENHPVLHDVLALAADNRRLRDAPAREALERDHDQLHHALERQRTGEAERLQQKKLLALAEFAAGAAHEINNPLAVISGQAQYLLAQEQVPGEPAGVRPGVEAPSADRQRSLQTIIRQTQRIHQVLTGLMQFARPARPQCQSVDVRGLVRDVSLSLSDLAAEQEVRLACPEPPHPITLHVDPNQIATALECLLRNAIEAAPPGGWAGLRLDTPSEDCVDIIVEDSGSGPAEAQREHLFDPFYSGRQAGRGRGLGLPTAWRLAREHGGDVRYEQLTGGPTRFVLSLPLATGRTGHAPEIKEAA
jgi:two-component system, NtrC family, sensor kinase